jgi:CheY-like chemotaxis protein
MVRRILVADDSSTIQKVIKIGLANLPNEIRSVSSLMEATKFAQPGQFDLIIAGAGLPGVSAASDFKKLSEQAGSVPLIILMGSYDAVREPELRAAGIQMIMKKPFPPGDLTRMVQDLVGDREPKGTASPANNAPNQWDLPKFSSPAPDHASIARSIPEAIPENMPFGSVSAFDLGAGPGASGSSAPPVPEVEPARKGRPAFDLGANDVPPAVSNSAMFSEGQPPQADELRRPSVASQSSRNQVSGMSAAVEAFVLNELPPLVDRAVERYCIEHFKHVAREALTAELRRLAEEKARFLVDQ